MTTLTQIRRDTFTNLSAATPAAGELGYDTTNKRVVAGDGTTAGGIPHISAPDFQKQSFVYSTVGGTGDAISLTHAFPVIAYGGGLRLVFKASAANTGAVTVDVDGLGTKNLKKVSGGAIVALVAGDLAAGGIYEVVYDGTQFQVVSGIGANSSGLPAPVTGTLTSGSAYTFNVDFTTYSIYDLTIEGAAVSGPTSECLIDVSSNGFSTAATAARNGLRRATTTLSHNTSGEFPISNGRTVQFAGTLSQGVATGNAGLTYTSNDESQSGQYGSTRYTLTAAINQVRLSIASGSFAAGNVTLQPRTKR